MKDSVSKTLAEKEGGCNAMRRGVDSFTYTYC